MFKGYDGIYQLGYALGHLYENKRNEIERHCRVVRLKAKIGTSRIMDRPVIDRDPPIFISRSYSGQGFVA